MKKLTTPFMQIAATQVAALTNVVAETIAMECKPSTQKTFSAAELWNIQKQKRSFVQRRFMF